jgi:hypothetical protein
LTVLRISSRMTCAAVSSDIIDMIHLPSLSGHRGIVIAGK